MATTLKACPDITKFLEEFRSNESIPFGKKLQKLNAFINSISSSITFPEEADEFLSSIDSSDFYGKKTKLELASALKRPQPILEALKSDDQTLLNRALQFRWIYQDRDSSPFLSDPEFLTRDLSPQISYSSRLKLLHRLSKFCPFEEILDKITSSVERSYGLSLAATLIPSCSKETITNAIQQKTISLTAQEMSRMYKRYPEIIHLYITHRKINGVRGWNVESSLLIFDGNLLRQICKDDPKTFMSLMEEKHRKGHIHQFRLGPKLSSHLMKFDKSRIIDSSKIFSKILNPSVVKRRLSTEEYTKYFFNLFHKDIEMFQPDLESRYKGRVQDYRAPLWSCLQRFPPSRRFSILQEGFHKAYNGQNFLNFPEYFTSAVLQLITNPEDRNYWIDLNLRSPNTDDNEYMYEVSRRRSRIPLHREGYWEAFRSTPTSIDNIKAYLQVEGDVQRRADLLSSAVLSCFINKDQSSLASLTEYVIARFRNDSVVVRTTYLESIDSCFTAEDLDHHNWIQINELLQISFINNEFSSSRLAATINKSVLEKSIRFALKNNLPMEIQVEHYIKILLKQGFHNNRGEIWRLYPKNPTLDKTCLHIFAEKIGLVVASFSQCPCLDCSDSIISVILSLCESIAGWNKSNRRNKDSSSSLISCTEFPWLMTSLQQILHSFHGPNVDRIISALANDKEGRSALFPELLNHLAHPSLFLHFLKTEPSKLIENAESIAGGLTRCDNIKKHWRTILKNLRSLGLVSLCQKLANKSLEIAQDDGESAKERCNAIVLMSLLVEPDQFLNWIAKYHPPKDGILCTYSEDVGLAYEFRKVISKTLINTSITSKALEPALTFYCVGDYLKLILGTVLSLSTRSAVTHVLSVLQEFLVNRPEVSVKKHAIRLILTFSRKTDKIAFLSQLWESEKHHSIRKIIFCQIFEMFLNDNNKNTSDRSWTLLENTMKTLGAEDHPFLDVLGGQKYTKSDLMPLDRLSDYLRLAWTAIESLGEFCPHSHSKMIKVSLLECVSERIKVIDESFLEDIFDKNLFRAQLQEEEADSELESGFVEVAVSYLLNSESPKKVSVIAKHLDRLTVESSWKSVNKRGSFPAKEALNEFVQQLSSDSFSKGSFNQTIELPEIFSKLLDSLTSSLDPSEFFPDYLFMRFSVIFHSRIFDKSANEDQEALVLQDIGRQVGTLVDNLVGIYKGEIIGVISGTLEEYLCNCFIGKIIAEGGDYRPSFIEIIYGLLKSSSGSLDIQIVASHLLLSSNFTRYQTSHIKLGAKYLEALKCVDESVDKTLKILVNYRRSV